MKSDAFVFGVDYGTDSIRSVLINAANGDEVATSVVSYPRWSDGLFCNAHAGQFRQHPLDHIEGLEFTIQDCLRKAGGSSRKAVKAISVDTTGSSPMAVDKTGTPLALREGFTENPNAMVILWKDHTATREASEINAHTNRYPINYLKNVGGIYSSEWFWAKLLHVLRADPAVQRECYAWVEHCDWIPFLLTGGDHAKKIKRSVCAAGHKALWAAEFGGFPPDVFFSSLDPVLTGFTERFCNETFTADSPAGRLSRGWASRLELPTDVIVGIGAFDAHMGAVGGQIKPYHLSKVMGTSTCDMLVAPKNDMIGKLVKGICGQVDGSIIPGMIGLEAGQSAFGDTYAWLKDLLTWPLDSLLSRSKLIGVNEKEQLRKEVTAGIIQELTEQASQLPLESDGEIAIDWLNGRRTPDANQNLKAAIFGLNLGTTAPHFFRALVEATCFGAKAIVDRFNDQGVAVRGVIGLGGVARKSPYIMQAMSDVLNMPINIHRSEQTCASGAAMFAATAAGLYATVEDAMNAMGKGFDQEYFPDRAKVGIYKRRYEAYAQGAMFVDHQTARMMADNQKQFS